MGGGLWYNLGFLKRDAMEEYRMRLYVAVWGLLVWLGCGISLGWGQGLAKGVTKRMKTRTSEPASARQGEPAFGQKGAPVRRVLRRYPRRSWRDMRRRFKRYDRRIRRIRQRADRLAQDQIPDGRDYDCYAYLRRTNALRCVELVTMGQGKWLFTFFGHNALRVISRYPREDTVYNFGTFSFAKPVVLLWNYLQFHLRYRLSTASFRWSLYAYQKMDRTFVTRRLLLTPRETTKLVRYLRWHYLPKNRYYSYHHYTSNCSTKVRDALRLVLGEVFYKRAQVYRGATYRKLVMKQMQPDPLVMTLMDFGMGPPADRPLTRWQEMFLPKNLEAYLVEPFWKELRGQPIAAAAHVLYKRKERAPFPWNPLWIVWTLSLAWLALGLWMYMRGWLRGLLRITVFFFALLGTALLFMMVGTRFPEPPGNANILWFHPLHWGLWWALGRKRWAQASPTRRSFVRAYVSFHAVTAALYLLLKLLDFVPIQTNAHYVFFALFVFGLAAAKLWLFDNFDARVEALSQTAGAKS